MGEGSTGCCKALLAGKLFGRDGILRTLFSLSGSDSVLLKVLSGSAEAKGRQGETITNKKTQTMEGHKQVNMVKRISVPSPLLDAIIFLRFTFCGFCKTAYQLKARKKSV